MAEPLFPGGGYTDPLIMANALRPLSEIPGQVLATRRQARALALAEQQALRAERERQFRRDLIESERRIQAAGGAGGAGGAGDRGEAGMPTQVVAAPVSGDIGGVPFTARSPKGVLADVLGPSAAAMQREQVGDADALMARIAAGAEEQGEFLAGRTPEEAARQRSLEMVESGLPYQFDPNDPRFRQAQELRERPVVQFDPNDPRWARAQRMEDARGGADADEFMASVAALDEKAAAEGMDATGVIRSLMEGGVIPEEVVYGGTPEEAAKQVSSLLAGLTPGELQRKKEVLPGWADVSLSDFTRLLSEASERGAEELTLVVAGARETAIERSLASMGENPLFNNIPPAVQRQLASLETSSNEVAQGRGAQLRQDLVGLTMQTDADRAHLDRTRAAAAAANREVSRKERNLEEMTRGVFVAEYDASKTDMFSEVQGALAAARTAEAADGTAYSSAMSVVERLGGGDLAEVAGMMYRGGESEDEIVKELKALYPDFKGDYAQAASLPALRAQFLASEESVVTYTWDLDQLKNKMSPDVTSEVARNALENHLRRAEALSRKAPALAQDRGYEFPETREAERESEERKAAERRAEFEERLNREMSRYTPMTSEEISNVIRARAELGQIGPDEDSSFAAENSLRTMSPQQQGNFAKNVWAELGRHRRYEAAGGPGGGSPFDRTKVSSKHYTESWEKKAFKRGWRKVTPGPGNTGDWKNRTLPGMTLGHEKLRISVAAIPQEGAK